MAKDGFKVMDSDIHVLEPHDLWLRYIEPRFKDRAPRFAPIFEFLWPSGIGPRVEEPALLMINPYPWSAPLEEVRLKKK